MALTKNRLVENDGGAGLHLRFDTQATLQRVRFQGNGQTAFIVDGVDTRVTATNLVMVGNHWATPPSDPDFAADAILISDAQVTIINATLAGHMQGASAGCARDERRPTDAGQ